MKLITILYWVFCSLLFDVKAQQPNYTEKQFITSFDSLKLPKLIVVKNGFCRTYINANPQIWDLDDDSTTYIRGGHKALICIEGNFKNDKREGIFSFYVIDSPNYLKRYKLWEQTFKNNKLIGEWRTYTLRGTLVNFKTYLNDSLNGVSKDFWIDGKTIMGETEFFNGSSTYISRKYHSNGKLESEIPFKNDLLNGNGKKYYEDGKLMEDVNLLNGDFDGVYKYYHSNGMLWIEKLYKKGKAWKVVSNYTIDGKPRNPGTLNNGNGTILYYNEDGNIREIETYRNGDLVK